MEEEGRLNGLSACTVELVIFFSAVECVHIPWFRKRLGSPPSSDPPAPSRNLDRGLDPW